MRKIRIVLAALVFNVLAVNVFADGARRYLETNNHGITKSTADSFFVLTTYRMDIDESETFQVPLDAKFYNKEGKQVAGQSNVLTIGANIFIVFAADGKTVKEIYEIPREVGIGAYNGPGAQAAGFTPKEWTEEGYLVVSVFSTSSSLDMIPFGSDKPVTYNVYAAGGYAGGAAWYDENGNKVSSFNNAFIKSGSNKIRLTLREVNGNPLVVEVKKLPPQYEPKGTAASGSSTGTNAGAGTGTGNTTASTGSSAGTGSDGWDEASWDGWNGADNSAGFTVATYYGRVNAFSENDRTLTITREDGKYKVFKVAGDAWIFNKKGKKGKYLPVLGYETKVRYMVRTQDGKEEIIDVRPIIVDDDEEEPVDHKAGLNLKDGYGYISSVKEKQNIVVVRDTDRNKTINYNIPDFIECYDMYGRECTLKELGSATKISYTFTKEGDVYTIITVRQAAK